MLKWSVPISSRARSLVVESELRSSNRVSGEDQTLIQARVPEPLCLLPSEISRANLSAVYTSRWGFSILLSHIPTLTLLVMKKYSTTCIVDVVPVQNP